MSLDNGGRQPVILVTGADGAARARLRAALEDHACAVVEATDERGVLRAVEGGGVDLALLDLALPGSDGWSLLRRLRSGEQGEPLPLLVLGDDERGRPAARALALGAHDYVRKPYDADELVARVEAALRMKALREAMEQRSAALEQLNRTDPLTGLYNRRWLLERLRSVAAEAGREGTSYAVLMIDVDHFKAVNDGWGHEAGDAVLCAIADRLQRSLRAPDAAGRWGGEEFLIVLPATELRAALIVGERIRSAVGAPLEAADLTLPPKISASVGCAAGRSSDFAEVVRRADRALYRAKAGGRNRVESAAGPEEGVPAASAVTRARSPDPTATPAFDASRREEAVLAVLSGQDEVRVAGDLGVEPEMVRRWRQAFVEGGRDRLSGRPPGASDELRDRYLAVLAHELLIPLTVISGWAQRMADGQLTSEQASRASGVLLEAARRMEGSARDILDTAAVALGRLRLSVRPLDLRRLAEEAAVEVGEAAVDFEPRDGAAVEVVADRERTMQVLTTLLATARLHGGDGPMEVEVGRDDGEVTLRVTTRGEVLDFEVARQLFEPWPTNAVVSGSGIGLYVCRALVVAHGGLMGVHGDGPVTSFWVRLPADGPPAGELVDRTAVP